MSISNLGFKITVVNQILLNFYILNENKFSWVNN